ncbi:MAG: tetratricopeptide repeat protein [Deltaproteobacteria bacterium]|nr:tetratricopeptide repeat protein [Deltaproteobacteria bacterium]
MRRLFVVVVVTGLAFGCGHTPSEKDKIAARGHYEVAVAVVHEAQKAGETGDGPGRDAKFREALQELLDSEKGNPDDAAVHLLLGQVYFLGFRRHADAFVHLEKAIALKAAQAPPDASPAEREYPEAEQMIGVVYVDKGTPEAALPHFEKARTNLLYQTPFFAEQEMGTALFALGRHDAAAQHLGLAIQQQPDLCGAYAKLADVEEARGDNARQQKVLEDFFVRCDSDRLRAVVSGKLFAPAFFKLGESRLRSGAKAGAVEAFRACVARFPGEPAAQESAKRLEMLGESVSLNEVSSGG